jgi:hypothetical protein
LIPRVAEGARPRTLWFRDAGPIGLESLCIRRGGQECGAGERTPADSPQRGAWSQLKRKPLTVRCTKSPHPPASTRTSLPRPASVRLSRLRNLWVNSRTFLSPSHAPDQGSTRRCPSSCTLGSTRRTRGFMGRAPARARSRAASGVSNGLGRSSHR